MRSPCRYEDGFYQTLYDGVTDYAVVAVQARPQPLVQVPGLVVDRVRVLLHPLTPLPRHLTTNQQVQQS